MVNILEYYDDFCLESGASIYLWNVDGRSLEPAFSLHQPKFQTKYEAAFPEQLTETDN